MKQRGLIRDNRYLAVILSALMILSMPPALAACGGKAQETDAGEELRAASEETPEAEAGNAQPETGQIPESLVEEAEIPDAEWQLDLSFPDWQESINSTYAVNDRIGFYAYEGQGKIYLQRSADSGGFSLYLNDREVDVSGTEAGGSYCLDVSGMTENGLNSIQISGEDRGEVRVCIPYPEVIGGTPEDAGIREEALTLIDRIISADIANGFSSAQLAVVKDGKLVYENAWGNVKTFDEHGEPAESAPVTADTLYDLASNTKMYSVNYAVQYLLTQGEIDLDTRIVDILGAEFSEDTIRIDYEGYDPVPVETGRAWKEALTIRDLLRHQGGFPPGPHYYSDRYDNATQDFDSDEENVLYVGTAADAAAREETLRQLCRTPLMYEPGSRTVYSDVDYMVLCYCVEEIVGMPLDEYLSEVFWEPMGLEHITYDPLEHGFSAEDCAATELMGNTRDGRLHYIGIRTETIQGEVHDPNAYYCMDGVSGHAGLFANAADLAKLASVMLTGGYGEKRYFSRDVIDLFTAPKDEDAPTYGLGWWRMADHQRNGYFGSVTDPRAFGHQGFTGTLTMIDPENDLVIVLLTNKIHSAMVEDDETLGKWYGNYYTTATLGFVPQILEIGLDGEEVSGDIWKDLISDMAADAERKLAEDGITDEEHPQMKAYRALLSVKEMYE